MQTSVTAAELCRLIGTTPAADEQESETWRFVLRRVAAGDALFRQGSAMRNVYVVRSGFFKSVYVRGTIEHVIAFSMTGDCVGLESVGADLHAVDAVALTDAEVAIVPYAFLQQTDSGQRLPARLLLKLLCRENAHKARLVGLLGYPSALARVAAFLLAQGEAFAELGYSRKSFILPMRNCDIGSYLGLGGDRVSQRRGAEICGAHRCRTAVLRAQGRGRSAWNRR